MNALGMMVDLSHVGANFLGCDKTTTKPVLVSHSNAYALCPVFRNLKDDQVKAVAKNGGVIQLNFYPRFLDSTVAPKQDAFLKNHKAEIDSIIALRQERGFLQKIFIYEKYTKGSADYRRLFTSAQGSPRLHRKTCGVDYVGPGGDSGRLFLYTPRIK